MTNPVEQTAVAFRNAFLALGAACPHQAGTDLEINHSVNRHGERSSYFACEGRTVRVSDHDANTFFRVNEVTVMAQDATVETAQTLLEKWREEDAKAAAARDTEIAARDAYEAPFIAEFRAVSKDHEREAVLRRAYPALFQSGAGKQQRGPVLTRFRG